VTKLDREARGALGFARDLTPTDEAVRKVLRTFDRLQPSQHRKRQALAASSVGLSCALALVFGIPQSRAAVVDQIASFFRGGPPPGQSIDTSELPNFTALRSAFGNRSPAEASVIAQNGGIRLYAWTSPEDGRPCFSLDRGDDMCLPGGDLQARLDREHLALLAATGGEDKKGLLWGLAPDSASGVELEYVDGGRVEAAALTNGFIIPVDTSREPAALRLLTTTGEALSTTGIADATVLGIFSLPVSSSSSWAGLLE
jgi:hypothetical protein